MQWQCFCNNKSHCKKLHTFATTLVVAKTICYGCTRNNWSRCKNNIFSNKMWFLAMAYLLLKTIFLIVVLFYFILIYFTSFYIILYLCAYVLSYLCFFSMLKSIEDNASDKHEGSLHLFSCSFYCIPSIVFVCFCLSFDLPFIYLVCFCSF